MGSKHGVAKSATLIPVKFTTEVGDFLNALTLIIDDINENSGRADKSVVVCSLGYGEKLDEDDMRGLAIVIDMFKTPLEDLFALGVPFVASAGNEATTRGRENIDSLPKLFEDSETPIINVGGANYDGSRYPSSQAGSHLTLYAPGHSVEVQSKEDGKTETDDGTSMGKFISTTHSLFENMKILTEKI